MPSSGQIKEVALDGDLQDVTSSGKSEQSNHGANTDLNTTQETPGVKHTVNPHKKVGQTPKPTTIINYGDQIMTPPSSQTSTKTHKTAISRPDQVTKPLTQGGSTRQRVIPAKVQPTTPKLPHVGTSNSKNDKDRGN